MHARPITLGLIALLLSVALAACAGPAARKDMSAPYDPFEGYNRAVHRFNTGVDNAVIFPVLTGYRAAVPRPARESVSNVLFTLRAPMIVANEALQGDWQGTHDAAARGIVTALLGVGGIFDVASAGGIPKEDEDFGQTLAVWGAPPGPYIVVPVLGPSFLRDYAGYGVDVYFNPLNMYLRNTDQEGWNYARVGVSYLDLREQVMDGQRAIRAGALDPYAAERSAYYQARAAAIRDESPGVRADDGPDIPDVEE